MPRLLNLTRAGWLAAMLLVLPCLGCVGLVDLDHQLNHPVAHRPSAASTLTPVSASSSASLSSLSLSSLSSSPPSPTSSVVTAGLNLPAAGLPPAAALAEPMTLPRFLGIDVLARRTRLAKSLIHERLGHYLPILKPTPLPVPLNHPSNAQHASPAIAAAHHVQTAKADAVAKVAAVRVLAGESCHDNPHVEAGLLAALDDTSPDVRIAAIEAVLRTTRGCDDRCGRCCSPRIVQKLSQIAYECQDEVCYVEPSAKARRLARLAIDACVNQCGCDLRGCDDMHPMLEASLIPAESPPLEIMQDILGPGFKPQ